MFAWDAMGAQNDHWLLVYYETLINYYISGNLLSVHCHPKICKLQKYNMQ